MTYNEFIQNILDTRGRFACGDEYHERHHVIPKCCGGGNNKENLIDLYAREHFIAHKLLHEENPDNYKLTYAYSCMGFMKRDYEYRYELTPEEYEDVRTALADMMHEKMSGENNPSYGKSPWNKGKEWSDEVKQKMKDSWDYNKHVTDEMRKHVSEATKAAMTEEVRAKISAYQTGIVRSEETRKKMSESKKGKKNSEEHCRHMSEARKGKFTGENAPMFGKTHSEETKRKISENSANAIPIYCPELGEAFTSAYSVERKYGICHGSISLCLKGKLQHAGRHPDTGEKLSWVKLENNIS